MARNTTNSNVKLDVRSIYALQVPGRCAACETHSVQSCPPNTPAAAPGWGSAGKHSILVRANGLHSACLPSVSTRLRRRVRASRTAAFTHARRQANLPPAASAAPHLPWLGRHHQQRALAPLGIRDGNHRRLCSRMQGQQQQAGCGLRRHDVPVCPQCHSTSTCEHRSWTAKARSTCPRPCP